MGSLENRESSLPDILTYEEMYHYGYSYEEMLPLTREKAVELFNEGLQIYRLYDDDTEGAVDRKEEIYKHDGIFGIEAEDWKNYLDHSNPDFETYLKQNMV